MRGIISKMSEKRNIRDHKRRLLADKYELRRKLYKAFCKDPDLPSDMRDRHRYKLSKLPRNSAFARLAVEYESNVLFVKVDTDDDYEFSRDMQVRGLPTLIFISPDPTKDAIRTEGLIPTQMIRDIINNDM